MVIPRPAEGYASVSVDAVTEGSVVIEAEVFERLGPVIGWFPIVEIVVVFWLYAEAVADGSLFGTGKRFGSQ